MRRIIKDGVLSLAGIVGLGAILWLVASTAFGLSLIIFKTGSMSPTMPTGSAAVVVTIPASAIEVGDVITVQRDDATLPVTHRVVSVAPVPGDAQARVVELRGDANLVDDQFPYTVTSVKRVAFPIPYLGTVLAVSRTPLFLGATTLGVAALVMWAFWPTTEPNRTRPQSHRADGRTTLLLPPEPASRPAPNAQLFGVTSD